MLLIWRRWRGWRRGRPFWGGLFTVIAGVEIGVLPLAPMKVMLHEGTAGIPSVLLAAIVVVLGLSGWFAPQYRGLAGIITVMLAAAALVLSNLGGFMIGTLLGVIGGALMFAWRPVPAAPPEEAGEGEADGDGDRDGVVVAAPPAAQTAVFRSEAPEPSRTSGQLGPSGGSGASGGSGPSGTSSTYGTTSTPSTTSTSSTSDSADSSLAAAFGVDDESFPSPRGSAPRTRGQD